MRNIKKALVFTLALSLFAGGAPTPTTNIEKVKEIDVLFTRTVDVKADEIKTTNIAYNYSKGTLTISGIGVLGNNTYSGLKKRDVKKIVIKDGITSLGEHAIYGFENLKSVEIPNTVTTIENNAFYNSKIEKVTIPKSVKKIGFCIAQTGSIKNLVIPGTIEIDEKYIDMEELKPRICCKTVTFSSTPSDKVIGAMRCYNYSVSKKNKKYSSYNGILYSKSGKTLVHVPTERVNVKTKKGCKTVNLNTFFRGSDGEADAPISKVHKIIFSSSVKNLKLDTYANGISRDGRIIKEYMNYYRDSDIKVKIEGKKLTSKSIANVFKAFGENKSLYKLKKVKKEKGMYYTGKYLLKYKGKNKSVTIPSNIEEICPGAFRGKKITKVKLNKKLKVIGTNAFEGCKLKSIQFPSKLKVVGLRAFSNNKISKITIPNSVKYWGACTFENNPVKEIVFGDNVSELNWELFFNNKRNAHLKELNIPSNITYLPLLGFESYSVQKLILNNPNTIIGKFTFSIVDEIEEKFEPDKFIPYMAVDHSKEDTYVVSKITGASGIEIQTYTKEDMSDAVVQTLPNEKTSITIEYVPELKIRGRVFTNDSGKKNYGPWTELY